jgi:hypothetical protein
MTAPFQSKLIPYEDFIRECRAKRWTYPRIAEALQKEHNLKAAVSTIFNFVKVRARKRSVYALPPKEKTEGPAGGLSKAVTETKPKMVLDYSMQIPFLE